VRGKFKIDTVMTSDRFRNEIETHPAMVAISNPAVSLRWAQERLKWAFWMVLLMAGMAIPKTQAQIASVLFQDDFASNTIDPAKYQSDAPFFEGGVGDIHAEARNGTIEFVGTTTQQWWSGGTLRVAPVFAATEQANLSVTIDRVSEVGVGTASRSALWILDETKTKYVLFADVRGEGGWRFNRKIGQDGDVPTGSGTDIAPFNGGNYDDGALHRMQIIANGKTVKLFLDGVMGTEVAFPFSKVIVEFGSYARANNDTAMTVWDNLKIEALRQTKVLIEDDFASNAIDAARYVPDAPFFEGGVGDIHAEARNGTIEFVGTTTTQWWSGGTLRVNQTFTASEQTVVAATIDRVSEAGVGSASRSAFWILDETKTKYVLFADVRAEGGWRFNRKIGEDGDVPTGSGTDIALFNGGSFDDGALHKMKIVADGKTAKLYLDGQLGAEVKFPYSRVIFQFGSYARANNDTAMTVWDNFKVETTVRQSTVVFADDFASNQIDPAKYQPDAPFFEGGVGDIHAEARNGTMEFVGTTTTQWWSGGTLRVVPTFEASEASILTLTIDRVSETGVGSASRSALWILDETRTKYVLFADVRGEGGWRYNRKIGEDGDVPTGSGTDIASFNGGSFDNGGKHTMSMVADGKTVKLLLNGVEGAEVKFPFSPVVFEFGSYARANNDTANTVWDNLVIETAGGATFNPRSVSVRAGVNSSDVTVKIPSGLNSQSSVQVRVVSADPNIAVPLGAVNGALTLNFAAGGPNTQTIKASGVALGGTTFSLEGDVAAGNQLAVAVISGAGVQVQDNFAANTLDATKWQVSNAGFEVGAGTYTVATAGGALDISGAGTSDFWSGASAKSVKSYIATDDLLLNVEVDRVSLSQAGSSGRSGVYLTTGDRTKYVFFSHNEGEGGWRVNVNPGSPIGGGTRIAAFDAVDTGNHRMRLVADGTSVEVFLDGVSGGRYPFEVTAGIFVELGAYARATDDTVSAQFDNAKVEYILPCASFGAQSVTMTQADGGQQVTIKVPALLHDAAPLAVTITSANPNVSVPSGAVNGAVTLNFTAGGPSTQTLTVLPVGLGSTTWTASVPGGCVAGPLKVDVVAVPEVLLTDDFAGAAIDEAKWRRDETPFDTGTFKADLSSIESTGGRAKITVEAETATWPGLALYTAKTYKASLTEPLTFEIDRSLLEFVLFNGTGANQRTGIWVRDANNNFVFFNENVAHDGRNFGWRYNASVGDAATDNPINEGVNIAAFDGGNFDDTKNHRLKMVVNGAVARLYLDGVLGAEVPFAFSQNLSFGFGAYVAAANDIARGYFDNARITGGSVPFVSVGSFSPTQLVNGNIVISWTGGGVLESTDSLSAPNWAPVSPAPAGKTLSVTAAQAANRFYRLRQ